MTGRRRSQSPMVECFSCRHHGNGRTQRQLTRHRQPSPSVYLCFQGCSTFNRKNRYGFTSFAGHCLLFVLLLTSIVALTKTRSFETHNIDICETINDYCMSVSQEMNLIMPQLVGLLYTYMYVYSTCTQIKYSSIFFPSCMRSINEYTLHGVLYNVRVQAVQRCTCPLQVKYCTYGSRAAEVRKYHRTYVYSTTYC